MVADGADVFISSWRSGSFKRFGPSPRDIAAGNPSTVYVLITAFGSTGPWKWKARSSGCAFPPRSLRGRAPRRAGTGHRNRSAHRCRPGFRRSDRQEHVKSEVVEVREHPSLVADTAAPSREWRWMTHSRSCRAACTALWMMKPPRFTGWLLSSRTSPAGLTLTGSMP